MSNERIVFTNPDGSVGVVVPGLIPTENGGKRRATIAEMMAAVPVGSSNVRQITTAELPTNRLFRNAWDDSNPENFVGVNANKAAVIAHTKRRAKRDEVLAPNLEIVKKNASGIPLGPNENAADAAAANAAYMTDVDDVCQLAIEDAETAGDVAAMEAALASIGVTV